MKAFKQLRDKLGISQADLARLIGIGRPMLTLVESYQRVLPTEACIRLAAIEQALQNTNNKKRDLMPENLKQVIQRDLDDQEVRCRFKLFQLEERLKRIEAGNQRARNALNVINQLESNPGFDREQLADLKNKVLFQYRRCCDEKVDEIKIAVHRLYSECDLIEATRKNFLIHPMNINNN